MKDTNIDDIIKTRVGKTPLVRAHKLEKELGISKIYLKLEGNNLSGHRDDRLAYLIIRDAIYRGKRTICMATYGNVGGSLAYLAKYYDVKCVLYVPNKSDITRKDVLENTDESVKIVEYKNTYEECVFESRRISKEKGWYDANRGLENNMMDMYAYSYLAREINGQLKEKIDTIFIETSNGASVSGMHLGFKSLWVDEEIETLPAIYAASTAHGNAIVESYTHGRREIMTLNQKDVEISDYNKNVINTECFNGQDALNAIYDTSGKDVGISDTELKEYSERFKKLEKISFGISNFYPVAAFMKEAENGNISDGNHVIIMDDGTVELDIRELKKEKLKISYREFLTKLDDWLIQFTDPSDEMSEAVENAFDEGFVLGAYYRNILSGVAVVVRSGFDTFFPKYHLAYIAIKRDIKGRGIATQLINRVIDYTNGDFSLHVDVNNPRAIKLYEKMGLRKKYYRMIYKGEVHNQ